MPESQKKYLEISLTRQDLKLYDGKKVLFESSISSALKGPGEKAGSECTPRGLHYISDKIGGECAEGAVFNARKPTGEVFTEDLARQYPERDWILTRILRLSGREAGVNKKGEVDSYDRFIYIHGTPDESNIGKPVSHGCIRMKNKDIMELFDLVDVNTDVMIRE